jgi:hypothetical protein
VIFLVFQHPKTLTRAFWLQFTVKTMASQRRLLPLLLLAAAICAPAFVGTRGAPTTPRSRIARRAENFIPLDAIEPAVTSYVTWHLGHMFWKSWEFQNVEMITIPKDQPLPDR